MSGYKYDGKSLAEQQAEAAFQDAINRRMMQNTSMSPQIQSDFSEAPTVPKSQVQAPETTADGAGGGISQVGSMATSGGMAAGNPYVAGAGIALQGIGMVDDAKRRQEQAKIDAYNKKIMAQRQAVRNIFA